MSQLGAVVVVLRVVADVVLGVVGLVVAATADGWLSIPVTQVKTGPVSILSVSV